MFAPIQPPLCPRPPRRARRRWPAWRCGLLLLGLGALPLRADVFKEYPVKAAFLYNFTKFVEWPPARFADETSPIIIGVLAVNPFDGQLEKIVQGRIVNGRVIVVKLVSTADEVATVHLLFVPAGEETRLPAATWQNAPVVAVGESENFAALGGTITFTREGDKVRFQINLAVAEQSRLKISAQLLKLATVVRRKN